MVAFQLLLMDFSPSPMLTSSSTSHYCHNPIAADRTILIYDSVNTKSLLSRAQIHHVCLLSTLKLHQNNNSSTESYVGQLINYVLTKTPCFYNSTKPRNRPTSNPFPHIRNRLRRLTLYRSTHSLLTCPRSNSATNLSSLALSQTLQTVRAVSKCTPQQEILHSSIRIDSLPTQLLGSIAKETRLAPCHESLSLTSQPAFPFHSFILYT